MELLAPFMNQGSSSFLNLVITQVQKEDLIYLSSTSNRTSEANKLHVDKSNKH